jgi:hypothetical protein
MEKDVIGGISGYGRELRLFQQARKIGDDGNARSYILLDARLACLSHHHSSKNIN